MKKTLLQRLSSSLALLMAVESVAKPTNRKARRKRN